ncbi:Ser/Thr phosphatase family protein [Besnoitia besnoiti]|uniref:Ser/Thr phosphatase family protein n=1 Tax=Besnoitia besnoiti TaxID=94643 RepID=A0A2A9MJ14_BESBE|nr:Ser/Thr phosphatase family protein [Besnoitia besnoiti]PFH35372.1 Ser/Thr phosphatase family protein [Besnoitia besnoiti]
MGIVRVSGRRWRLAADGEDGTAQSETAQLTEGETLSFGILADPQLGALKQNKEWTEELDRLRQGIAEIRQQNPAFIIVLGDLVQAFPSNEAERPQRELETKDLREALQSLSGDIPVLIVSGNHDLGNAPTREHLEEFQRDWGNDYYALDLGLCRGVVLNSSLFFNPSNAPEEAEAQFEWLKEQLDEAQAEGKRVLLFMHHAFFWSNWDESEDLGLLRIEPLNLDCPKSHFHIPKPQRDRLRDLIRNSTVSYSFHGHLHDNVVLHGSDPFIEQVVTSAIGYPLGAAPAGFRMVHVTATGEVQHRFVALSEGTSPRYGFARS